MKYDASRNEWHRMADVLYSIRENKMELGLPRTLLNLRGNKITFDFKWTDNPSELETPISLCVNGDTAPNRRFNYRFIWSEK